MRDTRLELKQESEAEHKEKLFLHEVVWALEQVAQTGCAVSVLGRFQVPTR